MTRPPDDRLHWTGRFADPAAEAAYRLARFADDRATARLVLLAGVGVVAVFLPMDLTNDPAGPRWDVFGVRLATTLWTVGCRWRAGRAATPGGVTAAVAAWVAVALAGNLLIQGLLPFAPVRVVLVFAGSLTVAYVVPLPLAGRLAAGLALSTAYVAVDAARLGPPLGDPGGTPGTLAGVLAANGFAAVLARRGMALGRRQFATAAALAAAREEVRTLRGLLPVCSFRKNIRDDAGGWHRMEAYITARTPASFTHGVCPTCMATEYGLTPDGVRLPTADPS